MTALGTSDLTVFPLSFGGNVFGWTADRDTSFAVLDAFTAAGGDFIDSADVYSAWAPGNSGGESETILGEWLASRRPSDVVVATKVSKHPEFPGLSAGTVRAGAEASLKRLGVDTIDVYYAHAEDDATPLAETVAAFGALVSDGLIRYPAISNFSAENTREWVRLAREQGVAEPIVTQPRYNLVDRAIERAVKPAAEELGLTVVPYSALASGFLTGKYRSTDASGQTSPRAGSAAAYATPEGLAVLSVLDDVAAAHDVAPASVALAWLRAKGTVPIASASRVDQVDALIAGATIDLAADEVSALDAASAPFVG
ncbi:Predicted oxidoreductase [Microbacterium sp. LKL04]|uniref:aldo/keto reductase n=1 Tax=unclassified Microbacterium TaxID=2609290 RepID=UPI000875E7BB|nr:MULTISPECIES: aldo/keto reductase [unclassified Microbacterium]MDQ1126712.1 aryl-alcohol dehydrogenase-like predicted oxidoreductase [Microbacterium sp. SORGH_AS_0505]SCY00786.1 Predicted oxidoreductase [Microbacterium sp. LKL04]